MTREQECDELHRTISYCNPNKSNKPIKFDKHFYCKSMFFHCICFHIFDAEKKSHQEELLS